jgi:hypothetical protein
MKWQRPSVKKKRGEACKIRLLSSTGIADSELERASELRVGDSKSLWGADQFKNLPRSHSLLE